MDIPEDDPFFVAYFKEDGKIGMRYTSDLSWRGGFDHGSSNRGLQLAVSADGDRLVTGDHALSSK